MEGGCCNPFSCAAGNTNLRGPWFIPYRLFTAGRCLIHKAWPASEWFIVSNQTLSATHDDCQTQQKLISCSSLPAALSCKLPSWTNFGPLPCWSWLCNFKLTKPDDDHIIKTLAACRMTEALTEWQALQLVWFQWCDFNDDDCSAALEASRLGVDRHALQDWLQSVQRWRKIIPASISNRLSPQPHP